MSSWKTNKLFDSSLDISSGAKMRMWQYKRPDNGPYKSALWVSFWLWLLSAGEPDIIDQVVGILGRFT